MEKEQRVVTFTMTLEDLLALQQALDRLDQTIARSHNLQMRTIDLLEKWKHEPIVKPFHRGLDERGAD